MESLGCHEDKGSGLMKMHTIFVNIFNGSEIILDVLGFECLSHVRALALRALRQLPSGDDLKGRSEWEYDIVHESRVLPSRFEDFKSRKHYIKNYLDAEDRICLIRTSAGSS